MSVAALHDRGGPAPRAARIETAAFGAAALLHLPGLVVSVLRGDPVSLVPGALSLLLWSALAVRAHRAARAGHRVARGLLACALAADAVLLTLNGTAPPRPGNLLTAAIGLLAVCAAAALLTLPRHLPVVLVPALAGQTVLLRAADRTAGTAQSVADLVTVLAASVATTVVIAWLGHERRGGLAAVERAASTDPLTGLSNRRGLQQAYRGLLRTAQAGPSPGGAQTPVVGVVVLDVDHFKAVNDQRGHDVGDAVLVAVADALRDCSRPGDVLVRLGGEELAWLGTWPDLERAGHAADHLRLTVAKVTADLGVPVTISAGVAALDVEAGLLATDGRGADVARGPGTLSHLLTRADHALYRAKAAGRDRVELADHDGPDAPAP